MNNQCHCAECRKNATAPINCEVNKILDGNAGVFKLIEFANNTTEELNESLKGKL